METHEKDLLENDARLDRLSERLKAVMMLDAQRSTGSFGTLGFFLLMLYGIGVGVCALTANDPQLFQVMLWFLGIFYTFLMLALYTTGTQKRQMVMVMQTGQTAKATIRTRHKIQEPSDIIATYHYTCTFEAEYDDGSHRVIHAQLPPKVDDQFQNIDTLTVRYLPGRQLKCMEEPSEELRRSVLSKRGEILGGVFVLLAVGLVCWGGTYMQSTYMQADSISALQLSHWRLAGGELMNMLETHSVEQRRFEIFLVLSNLGAVALTLYFLLRPFPAQRDIWRL